MIIKKMLSKNFNLNNANKRETSNFVIFSIGKLVSIFGSSIYTFAIGLYILRATGSGLSFATTLAIGTIPIVLITPFAGVIADRFDKKKVVVSMDMLNGVLLLGLYLISSLLIFTSMNFNSIVYLTYYCITIVTFGVAISFVDIPVMYIFQTIIP